MKTDHLYEDDFKNLDFILLPYAFLLGVTSKKPAAVINKTDVLFELLSKRKISSTLAEINNFFAKEAAWFKRDKSKFLTGSNALTVEEFEELIVKGAFEIKARHKSITALKKSFRKKLPSSNPSLAFGKIARYLNNGFTHELWYEETGKEIAEMFPEFDPELIASLLAITSIRAGVASNVTKFFKALHQYHEDTKYIVSVGKRTDSRKIKSNFIGFLDASLHHLNLLKKGESLIDPSVRLANGRKIKNFADAMLNNTEAIVDDVWITRAFGCDRKRLVKGRMTSQSPSKSVYDATEWYLQTLAQLTGKKARGVCAMIWCGIRQETTKSSARYTQSLSESVFLMGFLQSSMGTLLLQKKAVLNLKCFFKPFYKGFLFDFLLLSIFPSFDIFEKIEANLSYEKKRNC